MSNKINIEEDIEKTKDFIEYAQEMINDMEYERPVDVTISQKDISSIENILAHIERLEKEKEIHIKLEQQYKKEYLDEKAKYDSLVEKIKKKKRYFEEWDELIATSDRNYSDGIVIQRFIDTFQELLDTD